jgi:hypothetical protein
MNEELERCIPPADDDRRMRTEKKIDALVEAWMGTLQTPGGALARIEDHERRVKALEGWRLWLLGIVTAVLTSTLTAAAIALVMKGVPR